MGLKKNTVAPWFASPNTNLDPLSFDCLCVCAPVSGQTFACRMQHHPFLLYTEQHHMISQTHHFPLKTLVLIIHREHGLAIALGVPWHRIEHSNRLGGFYCMQYQSIWITVLIAINVGEYCKCKNTLQNIHCTCTKVVPKKVLSISTHLLLQLMLHSRRLQAQACLTTLLLSRQ